MKKIALLMFVLLAAVPTNAAARAQLDSSFGAGGRVLIPGSVGGAALWTAPARGGGLIALTRDRVIRLTADGAADPSFGAGGAAEIAVEPGRSFTPAGVGIDPQGRILVGGTSTPPPGTHNPGPEGSPEGPLPSAATVIRYLPDGSLDPTFGHGGIETTDFGLPAPRYLNPNHGPDEGQYERPVVTAAAMAVTPTGMPVLAGTYATEAGDCYTRDSYIARLDNAGGVDRGFGDGGFTVDPRVDEPEVFAQAVSGGLYYSGRTQPEPLGSCSNPGPQSINANFAAFLSTGRFNPAFGSGGERPHNRAKSIALAVDSRGRLVSLEEAFPSPYPENSGKLRVRRLLPTGLPDPDFGRGGSVPLKVSTDSGPKIGLQALTIDGRNRILIAGGGRNRRGAFGFQLIRLGTLGVPDRSFGRGGRLKTGFGRTAVAKATTIALGEAGALLVGGSIYNSPRLPDRKGFAFARYEL